MAYSAERHARAQELFNRSTRSFYVRPHLTGPYHLRERASKRAAVVASWHDNDQDEDYQPSTKRTPTKRKLSLFHEDEPSPRSEKKARSLSPTSTLRSRLSPEMGEPSTPSQHSEPDSSDRYWATNPEIGTPNSRYSLRRRNKESVPGSPQKEDATNVATSSSKPTADNEILVRECAACQELGLECSLASDPNPFAYPCTTCEVDDVFCVVSPPPKWKRSCESCKGRKKEVCSYRYSDYDHSQPCLPCRNHGFECVAGPARHPPFALFSLSEPSEPGSSPNIDSPATSNSPYESSGLDSLEESKAREQMNSPNSNSPARPSSPHGYPEADGYEALKPIEEPRPMKANSPTISNSPHGSPEIEGPEASNPKGKRNSPKIDTLAGSNSPRSNAQSSVVDGPKPHEVIEITDSDDDTPGKQNSPSDISEPFDDLFDSPPPDTVSNIIASQSANTRRIWTELAHPVIFLADNRDGLFPCDWCNNFAYGITGLGPRNPEVLTLDDGTIVELQDGHIAEGKSQSRMCVDCTWARSKIIQCSHNSFGLLPTSLVPRDEVEKANTLSLLNDASEGLIDTETGQAGPYYPSPIYQWCSLCREPAIGSCQEVQPIDVHAAVVDCDAETHGCGLMLCEYCLNLAKRFKGDLNAVVAWGRNDPSQHVHYRADMEFILSGAEHNTFYRLYMQDAGHLWIALGFVSAPEKKNYLRIFCQLNSLHNQIPLYFHQKELLATTSSPKRRKVSPEPRTSPGLRARRHGRSEPPHSRHTSSSSSRGQSSSLSPPRYVPAHLQFQSGSPPGRSLTPATATAGLSLSSDHSDMPSDTREGTPPTHGRSPSPGEKRPASEITDSDPEGGVSTGFSNARTYIIPRTFDGTNDEPTYPTTSSNDHTGSASSAGELSRPASPKSGDIPTIDEQVNEVNALMKEPLKDGQKGFVVSMAWLKKVLARTTAHADHTDKGSLEGDVGPVNNLNIMLDTDPTTPSFKDETGEPFVPMRPGLHDALDFAIIPQHGWELIQKWYGLADQSPVIIRYAHNTNQPGDTKNIEYETYPPIFTIFKLANPASGTTPTVLRQTVKPSVKILASRQTNYQKWLKDAKEQTGIDMSTKVRVWKILQLPRSTTASASATPAASRSQSPVPPLALISNPNDKLLFDLNAFLELPEGSHRVLLDNVKDQTQNANYNGRMTLDMAGLGVANCVVLEEQIGSSKGGEWVSEASARTLKSLGIPVDQPKNDAATKASAAKAAVKSPQPQPSGRTTPSQAPDPIKALISRGRKGRQVIVGLQNLGNTCYMNSALQCVRSIEELSYYFLSGMYKPELNPTNVLGCGGVIAKQWANLLQDLYKSDPQPRSVNPYRFRAAAGRQREDFAGYEQHDSQEFVMFLLDALSEDLSRIVGSKPSTVIPDSTDEMIHDRNALVDFGKKCWDLYEARNASIITDLFAGMYKSTLICHNCEKTSIIMDPFTMVTVPIPTGPKLITRTIIFYPLDGPPVSLKVRLDEHDTLKAWKDFVAQKMGIDGERILAAETLHNSFWQTFCDDDDTFGSLRISQDDTIVFFDLGPLPASADSSDSPSKDDTVIVPIFHRKLVPRKNKEATRELFGFPSFIRLSSEEAQDFEAIYRKLLVQANNMTTRDILAAEENSNDDHATDDSDTVVTNEDDARSADSRIRTSSVDGEDSMVDISMQTEQAPEPTEGPDESDSDSDSESVKTPQHPLAGKIASSLLSLFDPKVMTTNAALPDGRNILPLKKYPLLSSRIASPSSTKGSDASSESSVDDNVDDDLDADESDQAASLLHQGDAVLLDWTPDAFDSLFGGKPRDPEELRGRPTYLSIKNVFDHSMVASQKKPKQSDVTLDQCLDEFSKEEILSRADSWFCPQCKTHVSATKKFELWRTPDIMVVQLKRFSQFRGRDGHKISTVINFPFEGLDLSHRVQGPTDGKSAVYDLIAVDNHIGGMGGGHYTAYIKDFVSGAWVYCNDTSAKTVTNMQSMITAGAYLLFYRRRSDRALGNQELRELVEGYRNDSGSVSGSASGSRSPGGSQSPSDDGGRILGSAPRKGLSALAGGLAPRVSRGQDSLGNDLYSSAEESTSGSEDGGSEGKKFGLEHEDGGSQVDSFNKLTEPSWSFDAAHDMSQISSGNAAAAAEDGLFEGRCPWGDGMDIDPPFQFGLTSGGEGEDSSDDLPVVELRVGSEEVMPSDP
ncbi:Peptidase C19, ubiquitin carboxyl-terminal hydrolase 2 [Penicillium griseofulvum]|uniref:ubiquitinyl hydrolase 1 n=1 Tax=Penicillium patulum TaxID=5078 RepID=A0A135LHJ5_PENPA|nr:Peptidase C19, ubiquitin carboxyl-terminal hydrolase 2 [Penicillium griseofulvum]KXG48451.1 Peptidase C19, ubiquitin carboxyl-terminal hydrolase 2 [Penicillium griseofulvum]